MRIAAFDTLLPADPIAALPARLLQTSSRTTSAIQLAVGAALIATMAAPFALIASVAVEQASVREIVMARPGACLQIAIGLSLWTALFALPLKRVVARFTSREVTMTENSVHVLERHPYGASAWTEPLSAYRGLAHHIRTSVSGTRHELILVHPQRRRSVLLAFADRIHQSEVDRLRLLLGVPEIHARELYAASTAAGTGPALGSLQGATA